MKASVGLTREAYRCRPLPFSGIDQAVVSLTGKSLPAILQLRVVKELALRTFPAHFPFTANKMTTGEFEEFHGRGEPRHPATAFLALPGGSRLCRLGLRRLISPFWFALDRRDSPWWSAKIEPVVCPHRRHAGTWEVALLAAYYHAGQWPLPCPPSLPAFPPPSLRKYVGSLLWPSYAKRCFSQGNIELFGIPAPPELRSKRMFHFCKPCQLTRFSRGAFQAKQ